jgi:hypothetical protein
MSSKTNFAAPRTLLEIMLNFFGAGGLPPNPLSERQRSETVQDCRWLLLTALNILHRRE